MAAALGLMKSVLTRFERCRDVDLGGLLAGLPAFCLLYTSHYKMLKELHQMRRTQMSRIDTMIGYLKTNRAQLVDSTAAAA